jgi:hypothetical protein
MPLERLVHLDDDRYARDNGPWRAVVAQVTDSLLAWSSIAPSAERHHSRAGQSVQGAGRRIVCA